MFNYFLEIDSDFVVVVVNSCCCCLSRGCEEIVNMEKYNIRATLKVNSLAPLKAPNTRPTF